MIIPEPAVSVYTLDYEHDTRIRIFRRYFPPMDEFAGMHVDAYTITTEHSVVICDTLLCAADMELVMTHVRPTLTTGRQLLVLNSHADWDHTWGNNYFTGQNSAPLLAQQHCRVRMQSAEAQTELLTYQKRDPLFQQVALTAPTLTFTQSMTLHGGDLTLELFSAPGHSSDSCALWIPELRLLLAFDTLEAPLPLLESAASVQPLINTLQRFLALQPQHVLCSHSMGNTALIHANLTYVETLVERCRTLLNTTPEYAVELLAASYDAFAGRADGTPIPAFYRQAHEHNIRFIMQSVRNHAVG